MLTHNLHFDNQYHSLRQSHLKIFILHYVLVLYLIIDSLSLQVFTLSQFVARRTHTFSHMDSFNGKLGTAYTMQHALFFNLF